MGVVDQHLGAVESRAEVGGNGDADRLPTEDIADVDPGRLARQRPGQRQVRGVENAGGDRLAGPAGDPGHADLGHVARSSMHTLRKRHMMERLALASRWLSYRNSLAGSIDLSAALAVGEDTGVVDGGQNLTRVGPEDKPRGDRGNYVLYRP